MYVSGNLIVVDESVDKKLVANYKMFSKLMADKESVDQLSVGVDDDCVKGTVAVHELSRKINRLEVEVLW